MALHGEIRVNGQTIGGFDITRQSTLPDGGASPDDVFTYHCNVHQDQTLEGNPAIQVGFDIEHRYGDGALALVAKALDVASAQAGVAL